MIAQLEQEPQTHAMNISKFERFFRMGAGLDVDKQDLKRYSEFVHHKLYDLLLRGNSTAGANGRDVVEFFDLPITKGLQECIQVFREIDEDIELQSILDRLAIRPPLGRTLSPGTEAELPRIIGGLSVALARSFKIIEPGLKNPAAKHWERSFRVFDLLL